MARPTDDLNSPTEAERLRATDGVSPEERLRGEGSLLSEPERQDLADPTLSEAERRGMRDQSRAARPGFLDEDFDEAGPTRRETLVGTGSSEATRLPEGGTIELIEERAVIGKRQRDAGGVRVSTRTEVVSETVRDTLTDTMVEVEHVPVGRFVEAVEEARVEGDVTVVPVYEERLVVEKRLFLVEEVHLRRVSRTHEVEVPVELLRQTAQVERLPPLDDVTSTADIHKEQPE